MTSAVIGIASGKMKAELAPALGGTVLSLRFDGRDVLRPARSEEAVAADPREAACYPCVPWFSRLPGGLDFDGRHYDLGPTLPACDPEYALHGHGWTSAWEITAQTPDRLACAFDYAPAALGFPFPFRAQQDFCLSERGFEIALSVKNTGPAPMPAGLGLHPFFPCTKETRLCFTEHFAKPKQSGMLVPTEGLDHKGAIPDDPVDYTVKIWDGEAVVIHDRLRIALNSNARILHLYSPEEADFYCAEPVTHAPGHFGEKVLGSEESLKLFLKIEIIQNTEKLS